MIDFLNKFSRTSCSHILIALVAMLILRHIFGEQYKVFYWIVLFIVGYLYELWQGKASDTLYDIIANMIGLTLGLFL